RVADTGQTLSYQTYRFVNRRISGAVNERTLIATVLPPGRFCGDTAQTTRNVLTSAATLFLTAIVNSFVADAEMRRRVSQHCDMHFMYAMRIPRLTDKDPAFTPIVSRSAKLICTTPEFDDLAREVGL